MSPLQVNDLELSNRKAGQENSELSRQLEEVDQNVSMLHKLRHQLNTQLEDLKKTYEEEAKERQSLLGRYRNLKHEQEGLQVRQQ
jgi:myosin heavy chain 6/7